MSQVVVSHYLNKSQIYYYGLRITKGLNTPDLHGTLLLIWTLSMINDFYDRDIKWNVLKPKKYKIKYVR